MYDVFWEFEAPDYGEAGIKEFQDYTAQDAIARMLKINKLFMWGCFEYKKVIGVIATKSPCHISLLFVDKHYHRRGVARKLYDTALAQCIAQEACKGMTVHSSPYAVQAYKRLGVCVCNAEQTVNGIRFIPMKHVF